jgi:hypothetical protein
MESKTDVTGEILLLSTAHLEAAANQFAFAQKFGSCVHMKLQKEWAQLGGDSFSLIVYDSIRKNETQSDSAFRKDLSDLEEIWRERLSAERGKKERKQ